MLLLNEGQRPLLEFLRNLTPQVLLASFSILLWTRLDIQRFDITNWVPTVGFFLSVGLLILAFNANMNQFMDALLDSLTPYQRVARRLRRRGVAPRKAGLATLRVMFRTERTLWIDFIVSIAVLEVGVLVVSSTALNAVKAALRSY